MKYVKQQTLEIVEAAIVNDDYAIDFADRGILSKKNNKNEKETTNQGFEIL